MSRHFSQRNTYIAQLPFFWKSGIIPSNHYQGEAAMLHFDTGKLCHRSWDESFFYALKYAHYQLCYAMGCPLFFRPDYRVGMRLASYDCRTRKV